MNQRHSTFIIVLIVFFAVFYIFSTSIHFVTGTSTVNSSLVNLTIWDQTDARGGSLARYTNCSEYCIQKGKSTEGEITLWNVYFFANFTNLTSKASMTDANCTIRFRENLTTEYNNWQNMTYNSTADAFVYNRSFNYQDNLTWEVNCSNMTSDYGALNTTDNVTIKNTRPYIIGTDPEGKLPTQSVTEDTLFTYNLSMNVSEDDFNDWAILSYSTASANTTLKNYTLSATGLLTVNITTDNDASPSSQNYVWQVLDSGSTPSSATLPSTITAVNDAPQFINLNDTLNATENIFFNFTVRARDEESNVPFSFNITFINCTTASWSTRNSTNCNLFNLTTYNNSAVLINFTPANNDVGNYTIEFNVTDAGNTILPYNASRTKTIIFTVINVNNPPNITYLCNNERNAAEDTNFECWVTANDTDEAYNLTFISNTTWFTFNNSKMRFTANISENATAQINFTANDSMVGVWYINMSVNDTSGGLFSRVINFNISNANDSVALGHLNSSYETYAQAEFYLGINASDDDLRIPSQGKSCSSGCYNESLTFTGNITGRNITLFTVVKNTTSKNTTTAYIRFNPTNNDSGNYTVNITVRDANNWSIASAVFNLTIYNNTAPYWVDLTTTTFDAYDNSTFSLNLNANATDSESDSITFSDNTTLFDINSSGYISFSANDSVVGTHNVTITITDARGAANSTRSFVFTIHNINETPVLYTISDQTVDEDTELTVNFSANDEDLDLTLNYFASDFYAENIVWSLNSTTSWFNGANATTKLNFTRIDNRSAYIRFTPNKTDVGVHIINISISDSTGKMDSQEFTLTISAVNHPPILDYIGPRNITVNQTFYLDINATDLEDGSDNITGNNNFTFASNETWFNLTDDKTGIINITFTNNSYVGYHWINISVNDSSNSADSEVFRLTIYSINLPPEIQEDDFIPPYLDVGTVENCTSSDCSTYRTFYINATDPNSGVPNNDTLTIIWRIDGVANKTSTNATPGIFSAWSFATNFSDEGVRNITAEVSDQFNLTDSHSWNVTVNHTNAPVYFTGTVSNISDSYTSYVNVTCDFSSSSGMCEYTAGGTPSSGGYFSDIDHSDSRYNASINLTLNRMESDCTTIKNTSGISVNINNDTLKASFYYSSVGNIAECFNITAIDATNSTYNATSNRFIVNLTVNAPPAPTPVAGGGGGGGSTRKTPVALKIIVPEPFSMFTHDRIVVPIKIQNKGQTDLSKIRISSVSTLKGIRTELEKNFFESLPVGKEEKFDLTIITDTNTTGSYEVIINATVGSPVYSDSASFFVNLIEIGWQEKIKAQEKIVFLDELLIGNPECLELTEILNEAKKAFENNDYNKSLELAENAIQACKYAVSSKGRSIEVKRTFDFGTFIVMFTIFLLAFLFILFIYNSYKRARFRKGRE